MKSGKNVLGILAGVAAGAVLGILFAPEKGSTTRSKISRRGEDLVSGLKNKIDSKFQEVMDVLAQKDKGSRAQSNENVSMKSEITE